MVLLDIVGKFKGTLIRDIVIDDGWAQLNRSAMFLLMILCGGVTVVKQHAGGLIECDGFKKFGGAFVDDYCWTQGLYTIAEAYDQLHSKVPYPGIIPEDVPACMEAQLKSGGTIKCPDEADIKRPERRYHLWYQWVPFYFWLCAASYYLPYILYKFMGMNELKSLVRLVHNPLYDESEMAAVEDKAVTWLYYRFSVYMADTGLNAFIARHKLGMIVLFTKFHYLLNSVLVFWLTAQMFVVGDYSKYGTEWALRLPEGENATTLVKDKLFPKMIACEIRRWGTTGIEMERGMCVLAPNVANQYLFLIEWFCLVFVIACNCFALLMSIVKVVFIYGTYRKLLTTAFVRNTKTYRKMYYSVGTTGRIILSTLAVNVRPRVMENILNKLADKLQKHNLLEVYPNANDNRGVDTMPLKSGDTSQV